MSSAEVHAFIREIYKILLTAQNISKKDSAFLLRIFRDISNIIIEDTNKKQRMCIAILKLVQINSHNCNI